MNCKYCCNVLIKLNINILHIIVIYIKILLIVSIKQDINSRV